MILKFYSIIFLQPTYSTKQYLVFFWQNPKWDPAKVEDVDLSEVDTMLQPFQADGDELQV